MLPVILQIEIVVKGNLFARHNVPIRDYPNAASYQLRIAIRRATMINEPRGVPGDVPIQVLVLVQTKNVFIVFLAELQRFLLADSSANILDHARAFGNCSRGESPGPMNERRLQANQLLDPNRAV